MPATEPGPEVPLARVLYVDDNADLADSAVQILALVGHDAHAAYDGPSALRLAAALHPGVCFLDLHMPGMDGDEVAVRLTEQAGGRPILLVAVTAMSNDASRRRIAAAGFHHHLVKPADPHAMLGVLAAHRARGHALPPTLPAPG